MYQYRGKGVCALLLATHSRVCHLARNSAVDEKAARFLKPAIPNAKTLNPKPYTLLLNPNSCPQEAGHMHENRESFSLEASILGRGGMVP